MQYIILDTDMWIFLAQDTYPGACSQLERLVDSGNLTILVPEQVSNEWYNGKATIVRSYFKNNIKGALNNSKNLKEYLNNEEKNILRELIESVNSKKDEYAVKKAEEYILRVEDLIRKGVACPTTNESKIKASDIGLARKAPFHKKNSIGDALILLSSIEFLQERKINKAYFITGNKADFGKPGNESELHPDLKELFDSAELEYSINVKEVFRLIDEMIVSLEEVKEVEQINKAMYTAEDPKCPRCDTTMQGAYLRSQYGGLTLQWFCPQGDYRMDTGEFWD